MAFVSPSTWRAWKKLCSVAACSPEQRMELHSVIATNLREALHQWENGLPHYTDAELAQFFDEHFKLGYHGPDVRNKDYLFLRFANITSEAEWAKRITGYVRQMARRPKSVAEPLARREGRTGPIRPDVSADELIGPEIWLDASIRPDVLVHEADVRSIAAKMARGVFTQLNNLYKAVLWSVANDRPSSDAEVLRLAGYKKSSVANARKELPDLLRQYLTRFFAMEEPEVVDALVLEVAKAMLPLAQEWGSSGNPEH